MMIAKRIKQRRVELGLSADDIANHLGVSRATVYRYESADIENMGIDKIEPLAKVLQTTPSYLLGWSQDPEPKVGDLALSPHEKKLISEYRKQPTSRLAVDKVLGILEEENNIDEILQMIEESRHNQFSTAAYGGKNLHGQANEDKEAIQRILNKIGNEDKA